ncbi:MAG: pyridoxal phosphate-dependent aminotransferase [Hespellia sp.]|nr:pyridoxal phosphate-dependent aminotransferase [Hespellia sp.]
MYDFETLVDRHAMNSNKWANMYRVNPDVPKGIVPFSIADMEFKNAPEIMEGLREFLDTAILGYAAAGEDFLGAVCDWMQNRHDWHIEKEWIAVSIGVVPALSNIVAAFSEPGDGVLLMTPVYFPFSESIERNERKVVKSPLIIQDGKYVIDFDDFEAKAKDPKNKILLFCSPHNPVGRVWTKEELREVARICLENDVLIVSDEIHFDLIMPGYKHTVMATLSPKITDHCITCTSASKTFNLAGMQASSIIIPNEELRKKFVTQMERAGHFGLSILGYKSCQLAYTRGEPWLEELINILQDNATFVEEYMKKFIPEIKVFPLEGTYLQWWDCRELGFDYKELSHIMTHEAYIFMDEGFMFGEEGEGFERMDLACPQYVIADALDRLRCALKR